MAKNSGYIDLGSKPSMGLVSAKEDSAPKIHYPTVFISHKMDDGNALDSLPDGEFEFTAKGEIVSYKEDKKTGTCQCEIEIKAIKPSTTKAKKAVKAEDGLDEALTKISKKKSMAADEAETVDNAEEDAAEGE